MQNNEQSLHSIQKISNWLSERFGKEIFKSDFERTGLLFQKLLEEFKKKKLKVITIAGTNGKGETALGLEWLLLKRGIKTALWTSPHILSANERFRFYGKDLDIDYLLLEFQKLYETNLFLKQSSYYEFLFFVFINEVIKQDVDVVILEVGLGGRLDAVNLIDGDIMCITSISRDHENILGKGYRKILMEKLGITRSRKPLITALHPSYLRDITNHYCQINQIKWTDLYEKKQIEDGSSYRKKNRIMAKWLADSILNSLSKEVVSLAEMKQLEQINFKARMEEINTPLGHFIFNGAHNVDGVRKFLTQICLAKQDSNFKPFEITLISFSNRDLSEICQMLKMFWQSSHLFGELYLCQFSHPKAFDFDGMLIDWKNHVSFRDISGKLKSAIEVNYIGNNWEEKLSNASFKNKKIMVVGSYYFVGEVQRFIRESTKS